MIRSYDGVPESKAAWWARAFVGQCGSALDELKFLVPWTAQLCSQLYAPGSLEAKVLIDSLGLGKVPTLQRLADLDEELQALIDNRYEKMPGAREALDELKGLVARASSRARARIADSKTLQSNAASLRVDGVGISL